MFGQPRSGRLGVGDPDGRRGSGGADRTTNQRMEIHAALEAVRALRQAR